MLSKNSIKKSSIVNPKRLIALGILFIAIFLGANLYRHFNKTEKSNASNIVQAQKEVKDNTTSTTKPDLFPAAPSDNEAINKKKEADPSPTPQTPHPSTASVVLNQVRQNADGSVSVRGTVSGTTTGNCVAKLTNSSNQTEVSGNGTVTNIGNSYSCGAIDIPASKFITGQWEVILKITNSDSTAISNKLLIDIK